MLAPRARLASWTTTLLWVLAPALAPADVPTGSFEFALGGANSLWMGGSESTHEDADGFCANFGASFDPIEFCDFGLYIDGKGKIDGAVVFSGWLGDSYIALEGPIKGAQRGDNRSGITRASFLIRLAGSASRAGLTMDMSVSQRFDGQVDAAGVMTGTWTRKVCYESFPCETSQFAAGSSAWTNGHWTLVLEVESLGAGALGGSAQILFGDATLCDFTIRGRYNAKKDAANLALSPTSPQCAGGSLRLRSLAMLTPWGGTSYLAQLQYKLFGVSGTTVVASGATALQYGVLDFFNDPIFGFLPSSPPGSNGSAGITVVGQLPDFTQPSAGSSAAVSAGAMMTVYVIQSAPPVFTSPAPAGSGEASAMEVLTDSAIFQSFQSGASFDLSGFEARSVGPARETLDAGAAGTVDGLLVP